METTNEKWILNDWAEYMVDGAEVALLHFSADSAEDFDRQVKTECDENCVDYGSVVDKPHVWTIGEVSAALKEAEEYDDGPLFEGIMARLPSWVKALLT